MMKKMLCALLCAALLLTAACSVKDEPVQTPDEPIVESETELPIEDEPVYYDQNSEEYRELYSENAIETALDERFTNAMTAEDFELLSIDYCKAWKEEYHALMAQLMQLYPDDAEELKGLRDYYDESAQAAYDAEYALHLYTDEDGQEQVGMAAVQSGNFAMAEIYKEAAVLSILNDYREETPYVFHYAAK